MIRHELRWMSTFAFVAALISCGGRSSNGGDPNAATTSYGSGGTSVTGPSSSSAAGGSVAAGGSTGIGGTPVAIDGGAERGRCAFGCPPGGEVATQCPVFDPTPPKASGSWVLARIAYFLENAPDVQPTSEVPAEATAGWAAAEAMAILDRHVAAQQAPPGFVRFLSYWLNAPPSATGTPDPHQWSFRLSLTSADLRSLLTDTPVEARRTGIFTDPERMAARPGISSRGVWIVDQVLCMDFPPPPTVNHPGTTVPLPGLTRRQSLEYQARSPSCETCHRFVDALGFSFEHFDEKGDYRDLDNGKPIDSSGNFDDKFKFASIDDLAPQLAESCDVARCFAASMFKSAISNSSAPNLPPPSDDEINYVANRFADSNFSIRELVKAIVQSPSFFR